jgi:hypothetical protein
VLKYWVKVGLRNVVKGGLQKGIKEGLKIVVIGGCIRGSKGKETKDG